jgi:hypothetical protein
MIVTGMLPRKKNLLNYFEGRSPQINNQGLASFINRYLQHLDRDVWNRLVIISRTGKTVSLKTMYDVSASRHCHSVS